MVASILALFAVLPLQVEERVIVGTGVICRDQPSASAPAVGSLTVSDAVQVNGRAGGDPDATWLLVRPPWFTRDCWVSTAFTAPLDRRAPEQALLAVVDHVLATRDGRDFAEFVAVHNLFGPLNRSWARNADVAGSAILSLRRAQLVDAALATVDRWSVQDRPLVQSFILSQGTTVQYFEPGGLWHVTRGYYMALYERFSSSPDVEELLWVASRQPRYDDCETGADCRLDRVLASVATYWTRYPDGQFIDEAVPIALGQLRGLSCSRGYSPPSAARLTELRGTLEAVPSSRKEPLMERLRDLENDCR